MRGLARAVYCLCFLSLVAGCGAQGANQTAPAVTGGGGAVVVNLQDVLQRLGRDAELNKSLQEKQQEQRQQLAGYTSTLRQQYEDKKAEFGDNPNEEQQRQLQALQVEMNLRLRQAQAQTNAEFTEYQKQLVSRFREQVKPVAREIAAERNANIVLARDDGVVLSFDASIDITDEVVERMIDVDAGEAAAPFKDATTDETPLTE